MKIKQLFLAILIMVLPQYFVKQTHLQAQNSDLISPDTQVNYSELAEYLEEGKWRKANDETTDNLLRATGRKDIGWIPASDLENLSCWDLKTIDKLWRKYSDNRFGFSVQLPIYLSTGNRPGRLVEDGAYNQFGEKIGWRNQEDWIIFIENLDYSINAPVGHLPSPRGEYSITGGRLYYSTLAERMIKCNLEQKK